VAPDDGALPSSAFEGASERSFAVYLHVPFCTVRCGYCDFNTYTRTELGGGASQNAYADTALKEIALASTLLPTAARAARCSSAVAPRPCCPSPDLSRMLGGCP
jgi:oxygen-independent coproporphyrinogen-3 oxidase